MTDCGFKGLETRSLQTVARTNLSSDRECEVDVSFAPLPLWCVASSYRAISLPTAWRWEVSDLVNAVYFAYFWQELAAL
jgi:hypothetical protein